MRRLASDKLSWAVVSLWWLGGDWGERAQHAGALTATAALTALHPSCQFPTVLWCKDTKYFAPESCCGARLRLSVDSDHTRLQMHRALSIAMAYLPQLALAGCITATLHGTNTCR